MSQELTCLEKFSCDRVDVENHVIRGVSLMKIGPAEGHEMDVDRITLMQAKDLMPERGLKAKINHRDAGGVMALNGRMKNPRIDGNNLRADWHLNPGMATTSAVEAIAKHQPEDAGISLRCFTTKERKDGVTYMRVQSIKSADLVDDPAANESLLSARVDTDESDMDEKALTELQKNHETLKKDHDELRKNYTELSKKVDTHHKFLRDELPDILADSTTEEPDELAAIYGRRGTKGAPTVTELSTAIKQAVETATKPLTDKIAELETKNKATETMLAAIKQPAVAGGSVATTTPLKTKEETELQAKLETHATELGKLKGLNRLERRSAIEKELGKPWAVLQKQLTELKAKN